MCDIQVIRDFEGLRTLESAWRSFVPEHVFAAWAWQSSWAEAYVEDGNLYVVVARDEEQQIAAILRLYRDKSLMRGRSLRFLGSGKVCSEYQTLLTRRPDDHLCVSAIAQFLVNAAGQRDLDWDLLELESTPVNDSNVGLLVTTLAEQGLVVHDQPAPVCWRIDLKASWDDQFGALTKDVRRKVRKLCKEYVDSGRAHLEWASSADQQHAAMDRLVDFHQRRWRVAGIDGCFTDPRFELFLRRFVSTSGANDLAKLLELRVDDEPSGVSLFLKGRDGGHALYQCGMNPAAARHQSGWLTNVLALRSFIANRTPWVDYLRGDERYKRELGAVCVPLTTFTVAAAHVSGRFRGVCVQTEKWLREWRRQWTQATPAGSHD